MKKILMCVTIILSLFIAGVAFGSEFIWDPVTTNEDATPCTDLAGYKIYCGNTAGTYSITKDTGLPTIQTDGAIHYPMTSVLPADGQLKTWYCAAKAYDASQNLSKFSNEIFFVARDGVIDIVPPSAPGNPFRYKK